MIMGLKGEFGARGAWRLDFGLPQRLFCRSSGVASTLLLRCQQAAPDHVKVCEREHRVEPCGVLRQAAVAHLGKAPQLLHHPEGVLATGPGRRAQAVQVLMVGAERSARVASPIYPVTYSVLLSREPMHLTPVGLVAVELSLIAMQQVGQLTEIGDIRRSRHQRVDDP